MLASSQLQNPEKHGRKLVEDVNTGSQGNFGPGEIFGRPFRAVISRHFEEQGLQEDKKNESPELSKKTFMERNDPVDETYLDCAYSFFLQIRRQVQRQVLGEKILP